MTRGGPPAWELDMGLITLDSKKQACYKKGYKTLRLGRILWTDYLSERI
jgi:hypothetical protein